MVLAILMGAGAQPPSSLGTIDATGDADGAVPQTLTGGGSNRTYLPAEIESVEEITTRDVYDFVHDVSWTANASHLAVTGRTIYGMGRLIVYSFNGTDLTTVVTMSPREDMGAVEWSPDGKYLALSGGTSGNGLRIFAFNGTALTEVASQPTWGVSQFDWTQDGQYLAAAGGFPGGKEVAVYSFNGTSLTLVDSMDFYYQASSVSWNPEGSAFVVAGYHREPGYPFDTLIGKVGSFHFDGSSLIAKWTSDVGDRSYSVDWSPDGDQVVFSYRQDYTTSWVKVWGLFDEYSFGHQWDPMDLTWDPTGRYILMAGYASGHDVRIHSFNGSSMDTELTWDFGGGYARRVSWARDGRYLAIGGSAGSQDLRVYRVNYGIKAWNDTSVMDEDTSKAIDVLANDRTISGDLAIADFTQATHGMLEITPDGKDLVYTPYANWSGEDSFTYRHTDMVDEDPSGVVNITVDPTNDIPVITTMDVEVVMEGEQYSVQYEATDADPDDVLTWSFDSDGAWLSFDEGTGVVSGLPTNDDVGSYRVNVTVTDINATADRHSFLLRVGNVNDAPTISSVDVTTVDEDDLYSVYYQAVDIDPTRDVLVWSLDTDSGWLAMHDNHLVGTPTNDDVGEHVVNVTVSDGNGGLEWTEFTITVKNTNDPPSIISHPPTVATEDEEYNITLEAEDVDFGSTLVWTLTGPAWLNIDGESGVLAGTPSNGDVGVHWQTVTVTDGTLEDTLSFAITVANINDAPVWVETPDDQELMEGDLMFLDVLAADEDGDALTYKLETTPPSEIDITKTTGAIRWLEAVPGTYECEVTTFDGNVRIAHMFTVTVDAWPEPPVNKVPVIDDVGALNVTAGMAFQLTLVGSDGDEWDAENLTWTLVNGPEGMLVHQDGSILWLPDDKTVGVRYVTVELTDGKATATLDFEVEVLEAVVDDGDTSGVEDGSDYLWLVAALIVVVVALAAIMLWMYMGQRET